MDDKKMFSSVNTLSSAEVDNELNNFSIFNGDNNDKDILSYCVIVNDMLSKEEKIEDEEQFVQKNEEEIARKKFDKVLFAFACC